MATSKASTSAGAGCGALLLLGLLFSCCGSMFGGASSSNSTQALVSEPAAPAAPTPAPPAPAAHAAGHRDHHGHHAGRHAGAAVAPVYVAPVYRSSRSRGGSVNVRGYYRRNGTYVRGYSRRR